MRLSDVGLAHLKSFEGRDRCENRRTRAGAPTPSRALTTITCSEVTMAARILPLCPQCGKTRPDPKRRFCSIECRFLSKVRRGASPDCWAWNGARNSAGYGALNTDAGVVLAHRLAWALANGEIPDGMFVCHRCDNPSCTNPSHLFLGTHADNMRDMMEKGRHGMLGRTHTIESRERIKAGLAANPPAWTGERRAATAARTRHMWADEQCAEKIKASLRKVAKHEPIERTVDGIKRIGESSRRRWADPAYASRVKEAIRRGKLAYEARRRAQRDEPSE